MKKIYLYLIIALFISCKPNPQKTAEVLVKQCIDTLLADPKSYESISFGPLTKFENNLWEIQHTFRCKNDYGVVIKKTGWFILDSSLNKIVYTEENLNEFNEMTANSAKLSAVLDSLRIDSTRRANSKK